MSPLIATALAIINIWLVAAYLVPLCFITIGATWWLRRVIAQSL